jgi:ABC-type branched-subunit amino acid transport system ATPase component
VTAARGLVLVPEGRQLFSNMTVDENLENGGRSPAADGYSDRLERVFTLVSAPQGAPAAKTAYSDLSIWR